MPDRKQVIWDIERCICHVPDACRDCSKYKIDGTNCMETLMADALTLLREQEPVEPTANDEAIRVKYNCGGCGYLVGFVSTIHDDMQYRAKFCPECGKKVKWDENT